MPYLQYCTGPLQNAGTHILSVTAYSVLVKQSAPRVVNQTYSRLLYLWKYVNE